MKLMIGIIVACAVSTSISMNLKNDLPIEVVRNYFDLSREQKISEASRLWSETKIVTDDSPKLIVKDVKEKYRYDISFSKDIYNYDYEILNYKEFPKSDDSTVLCLSLSAKKDRKLVFRVELSLVNRIWKINRMEDAREDVLAIINKDCMPDGINILTF